MGNKVPEDLAVVTAFPRQPRARSIDQACSSIIEPGAGVDVATVLLLELDPPLRSAAAACCLARRRCAARSPPAASLAVWALVSVASFRAATCALMAADAFADA